MAVCDVQAKAWTYLRSKSKLKLGLMAVCNVRANARTYLRSKSKLKPEPTSEAKAN